MDYDDVCMTDEQRAAVVFFEYINRPRPPKVCPCYVSIPPGPDYYVPEIDGEDQPAEIKKD